VTACGAVPPTAVPSPVEEKYEMVDRSELSIAF